MTDEKQVVITGGRYSTPDYAGVSFSLSAHSAKSTIKYVQVTTYSEPNMTGYRITASDGKRIHTYVIDGNAYGFREGNYAVIEKGKTIVLEYAGNSDGQIPTISDMWNKVDSPITYAVSDRTDRTSPPIMYCFTGNRDATVTYMSMMIADSALISDSVYFLTMSLVKDLKDFTWEMSCKDSMYKIVSGRCTAIIAGCRLGG